VANNTDLNNDRLSVVVRYHEGANPELLDMALSSLAASEYDQLEVLVVAKNATPETTSKLDNLIKRQPWSKSTLTRLQVVLVGENLDGRSQLLNVGLGLSTGRYLAFLDYDDVIYQKGYKSLIEKLKKTQATVAVGGCSRVGIKSVQEIHTVSFKDHPFSWGKSRQDLFIENFIPIHSYVIDRTRCSPDVLHFDTTLDRFEDYAFLLRIAANYEINFELIDAPVCEYRIRQDGTNSVMDGDASVDPRKKEIWEASTKKIDALKSSLFVSISVKELGEYARAKREYDRLLTERNRLSMKITRRLASCLDVFPSLKAFLLRLIHSVTGRGSV
jgi:glycosyltransferase involved in cell wall biosynthesis